MTEPFIGEIRMFGFNFAPRGWAMCNGQLLRYQPEHRAVLAARHHLRRQRDLELPAAQPAGARAHAPGIERVQQLRRRRDVGGAETATLLTSNLPSHSHLVQGGTDGTTKNPIGEYPGFSAGGSAYTGTPAGTMNAAMVEPTGSNLPFGIMQPYLVVNFCIALLGVFPSRTDAPGHACNRGGPRSSSTPRADPNQEAGHEHRRVQLRTSRIRRRRRGCQRGRGPRHGVRSGAAGAGHRPPRGPDRRQEGGSKGGKTPPVEHYLEVTMEQTFIS